MGFSHRYTGTVTQVDHPDFGSLEQLLDVELGAQFMWMCEIELEDGTRVDAYKHRWTRQYLHLGEDERAFLYIGGDYVTVDVYTALLEAFEHRRSCEFTEDEERLLRDTLALARARIGRIPWRLR